MKPRHIRIIASAVGLAAVAALSAALLLGNRAGAVQAEPEPEPPALAADPDVIYDEQNVRTDSNGQVELRFDRGEHNQACLSGKALYVGVAPARNLDNPSNAPVTFQAVQHQRCQVLLVLLNKNNRPIRNDDLRITYTASAAAGLSGTPGTPPAAPELTPADVVGTGLAGLNPAVYEGFDCESFADRTVAQAAYDDTGGADGPLADLDEADADDTVCEGTDYDGDGEPG